MSTWRDRARVNAEKTAGIGGRNSGDSTIPFDRFYLVGRVDTVTASKRCQRKRHIIIIISSVQYKGDSVKEFLNGADRVRASVYFTWRAIWKKKKKGERTKSIYRKAGGNNDNKLGNFSFFASVVRLESYVMYDLSRPPSIPV